MKARLIMISLLAVGLASCATQSIGRVDQDNRQRKHLSAAAELGDSQAQFELGNAYCCGDGFYSTVEAIKWWCRAAAQGHDGAKAKLIEHAGENKTRSCTHHEPERRYTL